MNHAKLRALEESTYVTSHGGKMKRRRRHRWRLARKLMDAADARQIVPPEMVSPLIGIFWSQVELNTAARHAASALLSNPRSVTDPLLRREQRR